MSWESPQFRTTSLTLFAAGIAVLLLSIALAHSFAAPSDGNAKRSSDELPFLVPILAGGLLTFVAGVRISLFARPWNLVLGGTALFLASWLAPLAMSAVSAFQGFAWTNFTLLPLVLFRILGLIFSTTGALRILRRQPSQE